MLTWWRDTGRKSKQSSASLPVSKPAITHNAQATHSRDTGRSPLTILMATPPKTNCLRNQGTCHQLAIMEAASDSKPALTSSHRTHSAGVTIMALLSVTIGGMLAPPQSKPILLTTQPPPSITLGSLPSIITNSNRNCSTRTR